MKKTTLFAILAAASLFSCSKEIKISDNGWNAISFTEAESSKFEDYMNLPYINLTFPSLTNRGLIDYNSGIFKLNGFSYVFISHNWGDNEILVEVYKDGSKYFEKSLSPESDNGAVSQIPIKNFSFDFTAEPGEYSFALYIKDERGLTRLKSHSLHNTRGKMLVL
ncbi:MAG: hypothetical protein AB9922_01930 [Bacteroidales bacterium]